MRHILTLTLPLLLWANLAQAGAFTVRDDVGVISTAQIGSMTEAARDWPFDLHLLVRDTNPDALLQAARQWVDAPKVIVVAISPQFRKVFTRFGSGTTISNTQFDPIANAGKPFFKQAQWSMGVLAIGQRAKASVIALPQQTVAQPQHRTETTTRTEQHVAHTTQPVAPVPQQHAQERDLSGWFVGVLLFFMFSVLVGVVIWWISRRDEVNEESIDRLRDELTLERDELRRQAAARPAPAYQEPAPRPAPVYQEPAPTYVASPAPRPAPRPSAYHQQAPAPMYTPAPSVNVTQQSGGGSNSDGLLLGMMIGNNMNHSHDRERVVERIVYEEPPRRKRVVDDDVVTTTTTVSSWSSEQTSTPSYDSGGNSDSSFDSGGGGGDGGSSDF